MASFHFLPRCFYRMSLSRVNALPHFLNLEMWKWNPLFQNEEDQTGTKRLVRASALIQRAFLSKAEKASVWRKACCRGSSVHGVPLLPGAEKPSNVNRTGRFGLLSTRLQCGFKGSFMWGLCIHSCILVSWRVNPFSYHWQPSQGKRLSALVSGVRAKEDQRVSKPVNHGGTSANALHKLLWQRGVVRLTGQMVKWSVPITSSLAPSPSKHGLLKHTEQIHVKTLHDLKREEEKKKWQKGRNCQKRTRRKTENIYRVNG